MIAARVAIHALYLCALSVHTYINIRFRTLASSLLYYRSKSTPFYIYNIKLQTMVAGKARRTSMVGLHSRFWWLLLAISCHQFGNLFIELNGSPMSLIG